MSKKDYNKQLKNRQRIKETTLVVGIDIGKNFNAACIMNKEGEVLGKYPKIYNSRKGYDYFLSEINKTMLSNGFKDCIIGLEPTGHYWRKIAYFSKENGFEVRFVRTTALKSQRELDESSPSKNDARDAFTIANITREGKYIDTVIEDNVYRELRTLTHLREKLMKHSSSFKNALRAVLDDYFPELLTLFYSINSKSLFAVLDKCPFPQDVLKFGENKLFALISKASRKQIKAKEKAAKIISYASSSIGLKKVGKSDYYNLNLNLSQIISIQNEIDSLDKKIKELLETIPASEMLLSVPGIGELSAAAFLGEIGDPKNFDNPKKITKYAGFDPKEHSSGNSVSGKSISRKGRWLLRKTLFFIALRVSHQTTFFKEYYERKLSQNLAKKEALCAVVIKVVKVIFALIRDKRFFEEELSLAA